MRLPPCETFDIPDHDWVRATQAQFAPQKIAETLWREGRATYGFVERQFLLMKRYWLWELVWVIYSVAMGWLLRAVASIYVTMRHLRLPATVPATESGELESQRSLPPSLRSGSR